MWLARRHGLKIERDAFLEKEEGKLDEMRNEVTKKLALAPTRKQWAVSEKNEQSDNNSSSVKDLIYNSDTALGRPLPRIGQAMQSTAQDIMYPDIQTRTGDDCGVQMTNDRRMKATDSTIENLLYPTSRGSTDSTGDNGHSTTQHSADTTILTRAMNSTAQNLIYQSSEEEIATAPITSGGYTATTAMDSTAQNLIYHHEETVVSSGGGRTMPRALDSTAQKLMYHCSEEQMVSYKSTRGVGGAFQSTVQKQIYGEEDETVTVSTRRFEPSGEMKGILYGDDLSADNKSLATTSRGSQMPSVMKDILYPGTNKSNVNDGQIKSTRGSAPESTIQKLMYHSTSITEGMVLIFLVMI